MKEQEEQAGQPKPFYQKDAITLYHGDCSAVLTKAGLQADLILTSPPYDDVRDYGIPPFDFEAVATACTDALKEGAVLVWIVADGFSENAKTGTSMRQALGFMEMGLRLHDVMVYQKSGLFNRTKVRYAQAWEYMFILSKGRPATVNLLTDRPNVTAGRKTINYYNGFGRRPNGRIAAPTSKQAGIASTTPPEGVRTNVWTYPVGGNGNQRGQHAAKSDHPAPFPLALANDHILTWTNPGDTVLDPLAGSGTTLRAAKDLGRNGIGIEIKESYCRDTARWMAQEVLHIPLAGQ